MGYAYNGDILQEISFCAAREDEMVDKTGIVSSLKVFGKPGTHK